MAGTGDIEMALARVYGSSMLELAEKQGQADALLEELLALGAYLDKDAGLNAFFMNPTLDEKARERSIEKMFRGRASDLLVNSLQVLNRKGRLALFRRVVEAYRHSHQELRGHAEVFVTTAVPLTADLRAKIVATMAQHTGKVPDLVEKVDETLLGGLVVQIGDEKFDSSVARKLKVLGGSLHERALQEIHSKRTYVA